MFVLAPVKQQDEWDRPYIVRYLDIISDAEIEKVKQLAKPRVSISEQRNVYCSFHVIFKMMRGGRTKPRGWLDGLDKHTGTHIFEGG